MSERFNICVRRVLESEGGYSDHSRDRGGKTNMGITEDTYDRWLQNTDMGNRYDEDVRSITPSTAISIYEEYYWEPSKAELLPTGLDYSVFDFTVNSGIRNAHRNLQRTINAFIDSGDAVEEVERLSEDGIWGSLTQNALGAVFPVFFDDVPELPEREDIAILQKFNAHYNSIREQFYRSLSEFHVFGNGWLNRLEKVRDLSEKDIGAISRKRLRYRPSNPMPSGIKDDTETLVCEDIKERQELGINKYGQRVSTNPLELREWLQHAYEEALDQAIYLKRSIQEMDKKKFDKEIEDFV